MLVPWAVDKQLLWDVTVVDSLAPCRINAGSVCNPGTAAAEAAERKNDKYKDIVDDGYGFQQVAFEIQGAAGPSTIFFEQALKEPKHMHWGTQSRQLFKTENIPGNTDCERRLRTRKNKWQNIFRPNFLFVTLVYLHFLVSSCVFL